MNTNNSSMRVIVREMMKGSKLILEELYYMTITLICIENSAIVSPIKRIFQKLTSMRASGYFYHI